MLPSFLLSLREGLEAALLVGILLGALRRMQRPELRSAVWLGVAAALIVSLTAALALISLGAELEEPAEQIFEGVTMLLAAGVLTWMIFWMQRQSRTLRSHLESDVRKASLHGGRRGLFLLAFLVVVREGIELSLFLAATAFATETRQTFWGALLGLTAAVLLGYGLFATTLRLNLRRFFLVTSALLILFAAGLVAHGVHEFNEIGWIPEVIAPLWNSSIILSEQSLPGQLMVSLFGYNANPSLTEVMAYLGFFIAILVGLRLNTSRPMHAEKIPEG